MNNPSFLLNYVTNRRRLFYAFVLIVCMMSSTLAQTNGDLKREIETALNEEGLTGAVWSIVDADGRVTIDAAGVKNGKSGALLKSTDRVHVGSITKTILAVGMLRLATENKIDLDEPAGKYLPELQFNNAWEASHPVTIRHLMDHASGLTDIRLWQIFSEKADPDSPLAFTFTKDKSVLNIQSQPGTMFSYSNMGYTLLAMIIENVTKERYETYLDKNLLQPLGMKNSTFQFVTQSGDNADSMLAYGHLDGQVIHPALPMYVRPAGQFTTTALDMTLFAKFLMSDGRIGEKEFVKTAYLRQMGQPQLTAAKQNGLQTGYGLGAMRRDRNGQVGLAHSGNIVGYHAMLYWFAEQKRAFFISHNMDSETANYERFNDILIRYSGLDKPTVDPAKKLPLKSTVNWSGYYIPVFSKVEPLAYFDVLSSFSRVRVRNNFVSIQPFQKSEKTLIQTVPNIFRSDGKVENSQVFYQDSEGESFFSDGFSTHKKINGFYLLAHWISFALGGFGLIYLLISGVVQTIKSPKQIFSKSISGGFVGVICLLIPIPFFLRQSFVALGDQNVASVLLFISTAILPVGLAISVIQFLKKGTPKWQDRMALAAVLFSLQWLLVLLYWNLIPFRLWV
ncbi:serine hydrolase [Dyadobacter sp. CY312]|uniref:serine hydrolase domain-containing protein n=1 Tax=Dyadobacter sp. CY312 TaxID=2907303 RepID=UPI001F2C5EEA|nr:serine hydrolase domain-containing protein [Dyadobacter sp. CY312]MCE7039670.1 beta-lactamase family protein [Dyadobacter sp. CY312]